MRYRITQIKLRMDQGHEVFAHAIRKKLNMRNLHVYDIRIIKESIDARRKPDIRLVYTLDFSCDRKLPLEEASETDYDALMEDRMTQWQEKAGQMEAAGCMVRPVIAGFGPCGMMAALVLAEAGMKPIVVERGQDVDRRAASVASFWQTGVLDPESNVQFGEGGAGTFSDGKLTTGIKDIRISKVLKEFVEAGAPEEIRYRQKPHIGTDQLRDVVKNIRKKIQELGGEIYFDTRLEDVIVEEDRERCVLKAVKISRKAGSSAGMREDRIIETNFLILAIGHSARDTFQMLYEKHVPMEQKPFSIGVRTQHPQEMIDEAQYGNAAIAGQLGAADYKLNHRCENGRGVYTFCMCPGGEVINASSEAETAVTNGMSNHARDSRWANSGLLVDVRITDFPSPHPLAGVDFQRKYEHLAYIQGSGALPETTYGKFRNHEADPVRSSLPAFAAEAIIEAMPHLGRKLKGFDSDEARMTAVETRSSSPVRMLRDGQHQTVISGICPAGEGPGYAGGIMSAAVDGIKTAEKIMEVIFA